MNTISNLLGLAVPLGSQGFPGGTAVKNPPANAGDSGSVPGWGRSPGGGHGNPLQYSCLENTTDRGAWRAAIQGVAESDTTEHALTAGPLAESEKGDLFLQKYRVGRGYRQLQIKTTTKCTGNRTLVICRL